MVLVLSLSLAGCGDEPVQAGGEGGPPQGPPPAAVRAAPARVETVQQMRRLTGNLRAKQRSRVAVIEPGRVEAIEFDEADVVEKGDVLVRVDDRRLREDLAQAEAQLAVAEANQIQREAELERVQSDLQSRQAAAEQASGAVSETELRQARTDVAVAEALVNAAEKEANAARTRISRIEVQLEDTTVRAPFAGRVLSRLVEVGEYVSPGTAVAELASTDVYEAVIDVPETIDAASADAQTVTIELDRGGELQVQNVRVVGDVDPRSRRFALVADVAGDDRLSPGMSVTATVPVSGQAARTVVPSDAIGRSDVGPHVLMIVDGPAGKMATPVRVTVDFRRGSDAVLADPAPVPPGAMLVVEGGERIMPGQGVEVVGGREEGRQETGDGQNPEAEPR